MQATGATRQMRICVACRTYHPREAFEKAHPDFPTRDGLNFNCKASTSGAQKWMRLPNGRIEMKPQEDKE